MRKTGSYEKIAQVEYFIPHSLPPIDPELELTPAIVKLYGEASFALGQLNEMAKKLPDVERFIKAYVIKEALLSSAIEGIHTTLIDVFTHALGEQKPNKETQLVLNYTRSLEVALDMLKKQGMPITIRTLLAAHEALMSGGHGDHAHPGSFRKLPVRIGNLTPPPASQISQLMGDLEKYINQQAELPLLMRAGLVHVQFETIHPFLDGNGRIGRLLIVLMLVEAGLLQAPIIYPSYYFKKYHGDYYRHLDRVRTHGDFEGWIEFYLKAILDSSIDALKRAQEIETLEKDLIVIIQTNALFSRVQGIAEVALRVLFQVPIISITDLGNRIEKSYNTAHDLIKCFIEVGVLVDQADQKRNKLYRFEPYLNLLEKEY